MVDFAIDLDAYAGSSIDNCAAKACQIATILGIVVRFDFNGVHCMALPNGDPFVLIENQQNEQRRVVQGPMDRKVATTRPRATPSPHKEDK